MKAFACALALLVATPLVAAAEAPTLTTEQIIAAHARLVPTFREKVMVGLKVFAIKTSGRFNQPQAPFKAGDVIESVDGTPVTSDAGQRLINERVILGRADASVVVQREGKQLTLLSKALPRT